MKLDLTYEYNRTNVSVQIILPDKKFIYEKAYEKSDNGKY